MKSLPSSPAHKPRIVTCPACRGESIYVPENPFRPFCSERCKNADLGAWASESYRLEVQPPLKARDGEEESSSEADR